MSRDNSKGRQHRKPLDRPQRTHSAGGDLPDVTLPSERRRCASCRVHYTRNNAHMHSGCAS